MKKLLIPAALIATLAACETREGTLLATTAAGAAIGATVSSSDDNLKGALIGGAVGAAAGTAIDAANNGGACVYERPDGTRYTAACP